MATGTPPKRRRRARRAGQDTPLHCEELIGASEICPARERLDSLRDRLVYSIRATSCIAEKEETTGGRIFFYESHRARRPYRAAPLGHREPSTNLHTSELQTRQRRLALSSQLELPGRIQMIVRMLNTVKPMSRMERAGSASLQLFQLVLGVRCEQLGPTRLELAPALDSVALHDVRCNAKHPVVERRRDASVKVTL